MYSEKKSSLVAAFTSLGINPSAPNNTINISARLKNLGLRFMINNLLYVLFGEKNQSTIFYHYMLINFLKIIFSLILDAILRFNNEYSFHIFQFVH